MGGVTSSLASAYTWECGLCGKQNTVTVQACETKDCIGSCPDAEFARLTAEANEAA
jgi:hypothetical protein